MNSALQMGGGHTRFTEMRSPMRQGVGPNVRRDVSIEHLQAIAAILNKGVDVEMDLGQRHGNFIVGVLKMISHDIAGFGVEKVDSNKINYSIENVTFGCREVFRIGYQTHGVAPGPSPGAVLPTQLTA